MAHYDVAKCFRVRVGGVGLPAANATKPYKSVEHEPWALRLRWIGVNTNDEYDVAPERTLHAAVKMAPLLLQTVEQTPQARCAGNRASRPKHHPLASLTVWLTPSADAVRGTPRLL